jgi:HD domain
VNNANLLGGHQGGFVSYRHVLSLIPYGSESARATSMTKSAVGGVAQFRKWARTHCDVAGLLGARMGLPPSVEAALQHLYERWDGKGMPGEARGSEVPLAVRLIQVAQDADMASQRGGPDAVSTTLARRAGSGRRSV